MKYNLNWRSGKPDRSGIYLARFGSYQTFRTYNFKYDKWANNCPPDSWAMASDLIQEKP